jgi:hypothetical protein
VFGARHDQELQGSLLAAAVDDLIVHRVSIDVPEPQPPSRDPVRLDGPWSLECGRKRVERNWRGTKLRLLLPLPFLQGASTDFFVALTHRGSCALWPGAHEARLTRVNRRNRRPPHSRS